MTLELSSNYGLVQHFNKSKTLSFKLCHFNEFSKNVVHVENVGINLIKINFALSS